MSREIFGGSGEIVVNLVRIDMLTVVVEASYK